MILLVDDDPDVRDVLREVLSDANHEVALAGNGAEALAMLRDSCKPNVVLLDWMMPTMDGARFREEQRNDPALASIPVVILSASARIEVDAGVAAILRKPLRLDELLDVAARFDR